MKKVLFHIAAALTLVFIGLKLAGTTDWSWWWVFSPLWIFVTLIVLMTVALLSFWCYSYKHNEEFRKAFDEYHNGRNRVKTTLVDRLQEIKEAEQAKLERKIKGKED